MAKYINADILKEEMIRYGWKHPDSTVQEFIEDIHPAGVVEIVNCEDCMYAAEENEFLGQKIYLCTGLTNPNYCLGSFFCSMGKRREIDE